MFQTNIKGLKFYCQDIETGENVKLLDNSNNKVDGYSFGKVPKEDDKFFYFKSVECNSIKDKNSNDKYYPTFFSNVSGTYNLDSVKMDECLKSEEAQDNVLNQRIEAQKKYKIDSTPTILINEKKYDGKIDYKQFKKAIEKNL